MTLCDPGGHGRLGLVASETGASALVKDRNGTVRASVGSADPDGAVRAALLDEYGNAMAVAP
jgi:hypothetical protein